MSMIIFMNEYKDRTGDGSLSCDFFKTENRPLSF